MSAIINEVIKKKLLTAKDWQEAALNVIAHQGVAAVAVEPLARVLGVTKGSFYWHFSNRMDLVKQALKCWRLKDKKLVDETILPIKNPKKRLLAWFKLSAEPIQTHLIYSTLLADRSHALISKILKEITLERLAHLQKSYKEMGYDTSRAKSQSLLAYSVYVGFLHMSKTLYGSLPDSREAEDYAQFVAKQLIP
ncbi:Transcriptional regulator, AcrR family [hydrothermal vent metagenome]|uniref:Transcriptional regulator, AcrR family n=1 Tax=hydrothermal vent metagenome TaxID=652676 RepID=A0A3B0V023_9ZZZZ